MKIKNYIYIFVLLIVSFFTNSNVVKAEESFISDELGYTYTSSQTIFKFYSTEAEEVKVIVDDLSDGEVTLIKKNDNSNIWMGYISGNLLGKEYSYYVKLKNGNEYNNVIDPYGKFINNTLTRNLIYDESSTTIVNSDETSEKQYLRITKKYRMIYGVNVENFTSHETWGGTSENSGKLLGLIEENTKYSDVSTGYDYVSSLGITYIELSDLYDNMLPFAINKKIVKGEYAYSGNLELKNVSDKYSTKGIGIILAFDYKDLNGLFTNNISKIDSSSYLTENGNLDINKPMTQNYIISLLKYYTKEYMLSGIMIENMADYSVEFANKISGELTKINNNMYIYGDGNYNTINDNTAGQNNLDKLNNINMLNGTLTYALFGNLFDNINTGILDGNFSDDIVETLKFTLLSTVDNGEIDYSKVLGVSYKNYWKNNDSYQIINYLGNRNGLSVYDKLFVKNFTSNAIIQEKLILSFSVLMMSGGTPYIYSGEEFLSSYLDSTAQSSSVCSGSSNSFCFYTEEDKKIIDWSYAKTNQNIINTLKSYINFKRGDNLLAQTDSATSAKNVNFYTEEEKIGLIGYVRKYPNAYTKYVEKVTVLFNFSNNDYDINEKYEKGTQGVYNYNNSNRDGDIIHLKGNSFYTEKKIKQPKLNGWITLVIVLGMIGGLYFINITLNRKLVEKKGYDINKIKKKYRPFIRKNKTENNSEQNDSNEESSNQE